MKKIKNLKSKTKIIMVGVVLFVISSLTFSYSAIFEIKSNTNNQVIKSGDLSVTYGSGSSSVTDLEMLPKSDSDGLDGESASVIYIQNDGSLDSLFTITLSYDLEGLSQMPNYTEKEKDLLLPFEYLKMAIFEYDTSTSSMELISDVINVGEAPIFKIGETHLDSSLAVFNSNVKRASSGESIRTLAVKIWIKEDLPDNASGHFVYLNVNVESEVDGANTKYILKGNVKDTNSNNLNNAKVSIQNKSSHAITNSSGNFTLNNRIKEGDYLLTVTYNDLIYNKVITIIEDDSSNATNNLTYSEKVVGSSGLSFYKYLYNNKISIDQYKKYNGTKEPSTTIELTGEEYYINKDTFTLNGQETVNNINIVINLDDVTDININYAG